MVQVLRSCSKTACRWPAAASLSYRYATRQVWLLDLAPTTDPSLYDLCPHHADALVVPKGWERVDDRTVQEVMVEPSAFERGEEAARRRRTAMAADLAPPVQADRPLVGASAGRNRYAELVEQLPRLAAEAGVPGAAASAPATIRSAPAPAAKPAEPAQPLADVGPPAAPAAPQRTAPAAAPQRTEPPSAPQRATPPARMPYEPPLPPGSVPAPPPAMEPAPPATPQRPVMQHARSAPPMPSRELAPSALGESPFTEQPAREPALEPPLPGQLTMPVGDDETSGVVLPFDLAGPRRRTPRT